MVGGVLLALVTLCPEAPQVLKMLPGQPTSVLNQHLQGSPEPQGLLGFAVRQPSPKLAPHCRLSLFMSNFAARLF